MTLISPTNEALKVSAHEQPWNMAIVGPEGKTPEGLVAMVFGYSPEGVTKRANRLAECHNALAGIENPAAFVAAFEGMVEALGRIKKRAEELKGGTNDWFELTEFSVCAGEALTAARAAREGGALPTPPEPPVFDYKTREKKGGAE